MESSGPSNVIDLMEALQKSLELSKNPDKDSQNKRMADEEFIVTGYIQKGERTFSLVLAKYRLGSFVYKGHVTSGVTKDTVARLEETGRNPFRMLPTGNENAVWVEPGLVCVVEYMPNTLHSLRQPVFKGFRDDIFPEEVQVKNESLI